MTHPAGFEPGSFCEESDCANHFTRQPVSTGYSKKGAQVVFDNKFRTFWSYCFPLVKWCAIILRNVWKKWHDFSLSLSPLGLAKPLASWFDWTPWTDRSAKFIGCNGTIEIWVPCDHYVYCIECLAVSMSLFYLLFQMSWFAPILDVILKYKQDANPSC